MGSKNGSESVLKKMGMMSKNVRRAIALFSAAAVIGTFVPFAAFSSVSIVDAAAQTAVSASTTAELNVRSGAGLSYSVVKCIGKNSSVTVIERVDDKWLKVKTSDGTVGYCNSDYLDIKTDAKAATYLNLRKGPRTNYPSVRTLVPGTKMDILRFYGKSWMKVRLADKTEGYVCTDYDYITYVSNNSTDSKVKVDSSQNTSTPSSATVTISASSKQLEVGKTLTLTAKTTSGGTFTWRSSNTTVATVTSKGVVTGVKTGVAKITATDNKSNKVVSCNVEVVKTLISSISLTATSGTLTVGQTLQLSPKVTPTGSKVAYKTSSGSIAAVSSSGLITAKAEGSCTITVYDPKGGSAKATYKLTVKKNSSAAVTLSSSSATVKLGASVKLTAKITGGTGVTWSSSNTNVAAVRNGVVSAISPGTATIKATDSNGTASASCKVTVTSVSSSGLSLSRTSATLTAGKTLYIQGNNSDRKIWWNVSDTSIASINSDVSTYNKGFIVAKNPGKVSVTYTDASGNRAVCTLTVYEAEPIRFTYSSPNSAVKNSNVSLIAITDKNRTAVAFEVNENGKTVTVTADKKVSDGNTYVWTGTYKTKSAGTFTYSAMSKKTGSGAWKTCDDGKADVYVTDKTDKKTTAVEKLRASDEVIKFIGEKEGFVPNVVPDLLANNIPTLAHGYVVWEGDKFYNGLTRNEGYALLVSAVNKENYARDVNNMLLNNSVRFNQQQFDALVSFSYNLGTGWTYSSDLKSLLLNSYGTITTTSGKTTATVNVTDSLNLRESYTTNSKVLEVLMPGETVTLVSTQKYNSIWYKVTTKSGKTGYCSGTYLIINAPGGTVRDLNYVNKNALINELLAYHHAGGQCYYGLLYRRADELEMFLYGDYKSDGSSNKYGFPSPYCLSF